MRGRKRKSCHGMTLVEICITMALLTLLAAGIYGTTIMIRRIIVHNAMRLQACSLAVQRAEELTSMNMNEIIANVPFPQLVNNVRSGKITAGNQERQIYRTVDVVGLDGPGTVRSNLVGSAYLEMHVHAAFASPVTGNMVTSTVSTLIR